MPIMTPQDLAEITRIRADMRADRVSNISFRRAESTLSAQSVRISRLSSGSRFRTDAGSESRSDMLISGAPALDIQMDDRFTLDGAIYRVSFVRPNRDTGTQAEAELAQ